MTENSFTLPSSLDNNKVTLLDVWDHHGQYSPGHPVFQYESGDPRTPVKFITWKEASRAMHYAGKTVLDALKDCTALQPGTDPSGPLVVALFAITDIITAFATATGVMRAGLTVLLLSPRNSPAAVAHLLRATKCRLIIHSIDKLVKDNLAEALALLHESGDDDIHLVNLLSFDDTFGQNKRDDRLLPPPTWVSPDTVALIAHTSGSTSFPKPRFITHKTFLQISKNFYNEKVDVTGKVMAGHSIPHFHNMGAITSMGWTAVSGIIFAAFPPSVPPIVPTPQRVIEAAVSSKSDILFVVPSFIEAWASQENIVKSLTEIQFVWFAGGPLDKRVGDYLVSKGVNLRTLYGATELGGVSALAPDIPKEDWEYFQIAKQIEAKLVREEGPEDIYELIAFESPDLRPCAFNCEIDGRPAIAIGDLLAPHPELPDTWKIVGRKDDQIMHSNGEKTNPGPIERMICKHSAVGRAMMFGRERFHPGIIIEPIEEKRISPSDKGAITAFIDDIWPFVEEANDIAPSHSRIFKEMILVADPERPFKVTPKQTLRRSEIVTDYSEEISDAYRAFSLSGSGGAAMPKSWTVENAVHFVLETVNRVLGRPIARDSDFFQAGVDSLQVVYLRRVFSGIIQQASPTALFGPNLIYDNPTAESLGKLISGIVQQDIPQGFSPSLAIREKEMESLLNQHTAHFPLHKGTSALPSGDVILVTGTTGSLGAHVLSTLVSIDSVQRVYALNRKLASGTNSKDRQTAAFKLQGIDETLIGSSKIVFLEADLTLVDLGLSMDVLQVLRRNVTSIIHLAWKVDFNMSLKTFVPQIQGVRNLIDLALSTELARVPNLVFAGSISDLQNVSGEHNDVKAAVNSDPKTAVGMGYGESKWIASRMLEIARERTPLKSVTVRIGQLCGNSQSGYWNPWEWFPSIVRSGKVIGCLPEMSGEISWIPVDITASTLVDLRNASEQASVINLVHPHPVPWENIIIPVSHLLSLPVVPYDEWFNNLKRISEERSEDVSAMEEIPALKLMTFYESLAFDSRTGRSMTGVMNIKLDVGETMELSRTMSNARQRPLGGHDVESWLTNWGLISR